VVRKPEKITPVKLRIPERTRRMIAVEARKNKRSTNQEMVRRLERSFMDQGVEALIQSTVQAAAVQIAKQQMGLMNDLIDEFNRINRALGRDELVINVKRDDAP
jgi:hypothetical protein